MQNVFRVGLLALCAGAAWARPVTVEPLSTFGTPDAAYQGFGVDVAIDGDYAITTAGRSVPDPGGDPYFDENYATAFLFQRSGNSWTPVRRLEEYRQYYDFDIPSAVSMQNGIAAVQTVNTDIWELTASGWTRAPALLERDGPGRHLTVDGGRVINGDGTGPWNARVFEKDASGTWRTSAVLQGKLRSDGSDDEFRGGPADLSGNWAVVYQRDGDLEPWPEAYIFRDYGSAGGWYTFPYSSARPPEGASQFGPEVAIRGPDVFVAGGNETGTFVFRETPAYGFNVATRIQALDSFMGSGPAGAFAKSTDYLLQHAWSHDRNASVVNVFRRNTDGSYTHIAVLAAKNGASLGRSIAISGRRVLVGANGNGLVHYFEIPANVTAPARLQDTFDSGNGTGWTPSTGSQFSTAPRGITRVYRQVNAAIEARAVLNASDFTSQAIEVDLRPIRFGVSGSGVGVATRYQNPQNYFDAILRSNGRVELRRMAGGSLRVLASAALPVGVNRNYRVRLESVGTLHRVHVDGKLVLDADSSGPSHGRAALVTDRSQAEFDNVVVSPTLHTTMYASDFENGAVGPWTFTGAGFWNLWPGLSTVLYQSSIAGDARASIGVATGDQVVRARARLDTFASPSGTQERWFGLMARHVDERNFYYLSLRSSNTVSLRKVVNGTVTTLGTASFTVQPGTWYSLRLDAVGNRLRGYVDGALLLEATDSSLPTGSSGPVMFRAATDYDDFASYQP
jgi:hypothetical protein